MINSYANYGAPGYSGYSKFPLGNMSVFKKPIFHPVGQYVADRATALLEATWKAAAKNPMATRVHFLPIATTVKPTGGQPVMGKTALGGDRVIREDVIVIIFTYEQMDQQLLVNLRKFNKKKFDVSFIDAFGNWVGFTPDGTKFGGFSTSEIFLGGTMLSDGAKLNENELAIVLTDPNQLNENRAILSKDAMSFYPMSMEGTTAATIVVSAATTSGFTASVNVSGMLAADPASAFVGLAKADFVLKKAGVVVALTSATMVDNGDGTYAFTITQTSGSYTLELVAAAANSVVAYNIETPVAATFSIS
jgi:hypothetical protein